MPVPTDLLGRPAYLAMIPFIADDDGEARRLAMAYAAELLTHHGEVDSFAALLQRPGHEPEPLYCGYADEHDICTDAPAHGGEHFRKHHLTLVRPA